MVSITRRTWSTLIIISRRIGRDDEHVGMCLDKQACLFLVCLAQILAGFDRFSEAGIEILGTGAIRTQLEHSPQEVGQTIP